MMIPFNRAPYTGNEDQHVLAAMHNRLMAGDGPYTKKCHDWWRDHLQSKKALLTPSCTHALEMTAILANIQPDDEVIMPSYTFVSTANAFALRGAKIVFVDIRPDTMNIDEKLIESAITNKTKVIAPVHYAGVSCEMDKIMDIAARHKLLVIEDAAQGVMSFYKDQRLGTIGHMAAFSFHETKNITSAGEGGLLIVNDPEFADRSEIIREKGTNRSQFFRGMVDKYSWVDIGSSYLPGDMQAAYLWGQIEKIDEIFADRHRIWDRYYKNLQDLAHKGIIDLPHVPQHCAHNAHMFYIKTKDLDERTKLMAHLKDHQISSVFHYVPLHSAKAGPSFSRFHGVDHFTTRESERLLRLPLWFGLGNDQIDLITECVYKFYK